VQVGIKQDSSCDVSQPVHDKRCTPAQIHVLTGNKQPSRQAVLTARTAVSLQSQCMYTSRAVPRLPMPLLHCPQLFRSTPLHATPYLVQDQQVAGQASTLAHQLSKPQAQGYGNAPPLPPGQLGKGARARWPPIRGLVLDSLSTYIHQMNAMCLTGHAMQAKMSSEGSAQISTVSERGINTIAAGVMCAHMHVVQRQMKMASHAPRQG
jgi:hypothetical protein